MKSSLFPLLVSIVGCAVQEVVEYSWIKNGVHKNFIAKDMRECSEFAEKILEPGKGDDVRKTRYEQIRALGQGRERFDNPKNMRLVISWCMENRGYERLTNTKDDR